MTALLLALVLLADDPLDAPARPEKKKPVKIVKTPEGSCDKKALDELKKTVAATDRAQLTAVVSQGFGEACEGKLPKLVSDALTVMHKTEVDGHGNDMALVFHDEPDFVKLGCPKWEDVYTPVAHSAPGDKLRAIYRGCDLEKLKVLNIEEFANTADLGAAFVMAPLHNWLTLHGMPPAAAKGWMRSLLAVVPAKAPPPEKPEKKKKK